MTKLFQIFRTERGASAVEFALVAPVFLALLFGVAQLGIVFFANAGLNRALAQGARRATIYPRPTEQTIKSEISRAQWGLDAAKVQVALTYGGTATAYADINMSYPVDLKFPFFEGPALTLRQSRRVYLQPLPPS